MREPASEPERPIRPDFPAEGQPAFAPPSWLSYLRLFRLPNVFTAFADVLMGYFVTTPQHQHWPGLAMLLLSSGCLYTAGMVLNDVFDLEVDRVERPQRPLPAGQISASWARWIGFQLLAMGVACGWIAGLAMSGGPQANWRSGLVSSVLAVAVLGYNAGAKRTFFGPWVMGSCRALNVLLGMSLSAVVAAGEPGWLGFGSSHASIAAGIGIYIAGVTWYSRSEATRSPRRGLTCGLLLMAAGIALLAFFPRWHLGAFPYRYEPITTWPLAVLMISVWILRRPLVALRDPGPRQVQLAVKHCILSLIVLDAIVCSLVADLPFALAILALLAPTLLLGRLVYST